MSFLIRFIDNCAQFDLPVGFLKAVANSSYSVTSGRTSHVNVWLNEMVIDPSDAASAELTRRLVTDASLGVMHVYHEATHAWLDLNENVAEVAALRHHGSSHYDGAPLVEGRTASDPERIFQEAMGEYVGHRARVFWQTWAHLSQIDDALTRHPKMNERGVSILIAAAREARRDYDRKMAMGTFGYQNQGWFQNDPQKATLRPMTIRMTEFADRILLERRIPNAFLTTNKPAAL